MNLTLGNYYKDGFGAIYKLVTSDNVVEWYEGFGKTKSPEFNKYSNWEFFGVVVVDENGNKPSFPSWQCFRNDGNATFATYGEEDNYQDDGEEDENDHLYNLVEDLGPDFDDDWLRQ